MYKILGSDQKEYGPISVEQLRQWIAEGRINGNTQAQSDASPGWKPVSSFPELAASLPAAAAGAPMHPSAVASVNAKTLVNGPAIAMLVVAILYALMSAFGVLANLFHWGVGAFGQGSRDLPPEVMKMMQNVGGPIGVVVAVAQLALSGFYIFVSTKLRKLESYGLVMTATILFMLPCLTPSCCCILGLPIGIWTLVIIMKPEVKSAFR